MPHHSFSPIYNILSAVINANQIDLVKAAWSHGLYTLILHFVNALEEIKKDHPQLYPVLHRLCGLFGLYYMEETLGDFTEGDYLSTQQAGWVHTQVRKLLEEIRPDAIAMVDSFHFSDYELNSSLGRYNGDCYAHMYEWGRRSPLNLSPQPPGYNEYLKVRSFVSFLRLPIYILPSIAIAFWANPGRRVAGASESLRKLRYCDNLSVRKG